MGSGADTSSTEPFHLSNRRGVTSDQDLYHELSYYTLAHPDPSFIHQHIVDAYAAQHADDARRPFLMSQYPHHPSRHEHSADEQDEAVQAVADLVARGASLGDSENDRSKNREQHGGGEMGEFQGHSVFPITASSR
jgi:hypothetical protein